MSATHAPLARAAHDPSYTFVSLCTPCGRREPFTGEDLTRYGRDGWPVCCGRQMCCTSARWVDHRTPSHDPLSA